jgi:hypothetical protein
MDDKIKVYYLRMELNKWNNKIYRGEDGKELAGGLQAEEFWNEFQIKSYPKFENACAYHIPAKWADDVRDLITTTRKELGDRIEFEQIKEKWCELVVYYKATDEVARQRFRELLTDCKDRLKAKGVHPEKGIGQ